MLIPEMLARWARLAPYKRALVEDDRALTWRELDDQVSRLATGMERLGVARGDPVAILAKDRSEVLVHWLACMRLGAVRVGVNARYGAREVAHVIADCGARLVFVESSLAHLLPSGMDAPVEIGGVSLPGAPRYPDLLGDPGGDQPQPAPGDLALISYTSGTTGLPKGVLISHGAVAAAVVNTTIMIGLGPDDVWFQGGSLAWAAGIMALLGMTNGMTTVLPGGPGSYTAAGFVRAIERHGASATALAPVMIRGLLDELEGSGVEPAALRVLGYGSSPAPPALIRRVRERLPGVNLIQLYGATECAGGWVTVLTNADHARALDDEPELLGSCGRPTLWCEVRVVDVDGTPCAPGERGEVWVRTPTACSGYHGLPELTEALFAGDWLRTNDVGWLDERGYLHLTDRKHFMIITGGANVFPSVVEAVLAEHPAVRDSAVVGAPHPEWGEAIVAVVETSAGARTDGDQLIAHCRERLGSFEVPKHVRFVDELPRNPTGKIAKLAVRRELTDHPELLPWNHPDQGRN